MADTADFLIIESRDPFQFGEAGTAYALAEGLAAAGKVTVFLVENGVLAARRASAVADRVGRLAASTTVLADGFSLQERGIRDEELVSGVAPSTMGALVDLLTVDGCKAMWH